MKLNHRTFKQCLRVTKAQTPIAGELTVETRAEHISQLPDSWKESLIGLLDLYHDMDRIEIPEGLTRTQAICLAWYRALDERGQERMYPFVAAQLGAFSALL